MCICAVIVTIVEMLISDTALEKNVRLALGAFMLCAVIVPLGGVVTDLKDGIGVETGEPYQAELTDDIELNRLGYIKGQIARLIEEKLGEKDIRPVKTEVFTDIDGDSSINIIRAELTLSHSDARRASYASRLIKEELGIDCKTIISRRDGGG